MLSSRAFISGILLGSLAATAVSRAAESGVADQRPHVVVIMTDDMGFSDLGCYGGEIRTPHLDQLAEQGLRFTEFYTAGRCCPTRASLLTGQYQHLVGMHRNGLDLSRDGITLAEVLGQAGYQTAMVGKWHLTGLRTLPERHQAWIDHQFQPEREWGDPRTYPTARGFDRFYGTLFGVIHFFDPWTLMEGDQAVPEVSEDYYATDATSARAAAFIHELAECEAPFFLYVAYHAPHWPLHARPEDIARYRGVYDRGWDAIRAARYARQREMGLFDADSTPLPPIQGPGEPWDALPPDQQQHLARLMEVHAAMVDRIDQGVGQIVAALRATQRLENTLLLFLNDNGASPERYLQPGYDRPSQTRDGRPIVYQPYYDQPGSETTWPYLGPRWASAVNTPFRYWKAESYQGGLLSPLIVHWPAGLQTPPGSFTRQRGHVIDLLPTVLDAARLAYPDRFADRPLRRPDGISLLPVFRGQQRAGHASLFFEHEGHKSVLRGPWKANQLRRGNVWRLYDLEHDRTETRDLAAQHPDLLDELKQQWREWAVQMGLPPDARD